MAKAEVNIDEVELRYEDDRVQVSIPRFDEDGEPIDSDALWDKTIHVYADGSVQVWDENNNSHSVTYEQLLEFAQLLNKK